MTDRADVRETYDRIAAHFAKTRPEPWTEVTSFLEEKTGEVGLDLGAGNGRHTEGLAARVQQVVAMDASRAALNAARSRGCRRAFSFEAVQGDATEIPLQSACVDLATYIATIHHLPSRRLRLASLDELERVLKTDGAAIVSAWSTTHEKWDADRGFDTTVDWTLPDGESVPRFYHIYDPLEFEDDLHESALSVRDVFVSSGNCYGIVGSRGRGKKVVKSS